MIKKILLGLLMIIPTIVKAPPIANQTILKPFYILPNKPGESIKLKFEFTCNITTTLQGLIRITNPNQTSMIIGSINLSLSPSKTSLSTISSSLAFLIPPVIRLKNFRIVKVIGKKR
jgi:hypothetical protein